MIDKLFGSKTRVKLLHLFMNHADESYYVREITRIIDEQINSVRRELKNMIEIGVVENEQKDNKLYYKANKSYEFYSALQAIFSDSKINEVQRSVTDQGQAVDTESRSNKFYDWRSDLAQLNGAKVILLTGKFVSGSNNNEIDILVVGNVSKPALRKIIDSIEKSERISVNYATMEYEDFYYRLSIRDRFVMSIMSGAYEIILDKEGVLKKGDK